MTNILVEFVFHREDSDKYFHSFNFDEDTETLDTLLEKLEPFLLAMGFVLGDRRLELVKPNYGNDNIPSANSFDKV